MRFARLLPAICLSLSLVSPVFGWGREGHRLIAALAWKHVNGKVKAEVGRLLEPGETLESVAAWADVVRPKRPETSTWHYINIPITASRGDWKPYCPGTGCVVQVIPELAAKVKDTSLPREQRAEALKFLVHFLSDLHQPLHSGDKSDRGGNDVPVVFFDRPTNLHSLWDTALLEKAIERRPELKSGLERSASWSSRRKLGRGRLEDWLWETRDAARDVAYANLPEARPAALKEAYTDKAAPCLELQIRRAGVRLAKLLNETLGK